MSAGADFPDLIERLTLAAREVKALLAEVHGATKDLRRALAESAAERKALEATVAAVVQSTIDEAVKTGLDEYKGTLETAIADAEAGVYRRFDQTANLLLTGDLKGQGPDIVLDAASARIRDRALRCLLPETRAPGAPEYLGSPALSTTIRCPHCQRRIESQSALPTGPGRMLPTDGDISICAACAKVSRYADGGTRLRRQTAEEERRTKDDPQIQRTVASIRHARR